MVTENMFGPKTTHFLVKRQHVVRLHENTWFESKTAHGLLLRQHVVWLQDSTASGTKTAHCLVTRKHMCLGPRQHVVWYQDTKTYFFITNAMNGSIMAPHGLILSQGGAIPSRMIFIWVWGLFCTISG